MWSVRLREFGLLAACLAALVAGMPAARAQTPGQPAPARDDIVNALNHYDSDVALDIPALKQTILERSKVRSKKEPEANKRPPIVPEIMKVPGTFNVAIAFDVDTPIILPESYETVGRIADAMVNAPLLQYTFLIVGHTESNGNRPANAILSQRRADAIRDVLANTFKISTKRLASLGVGEEQFIDQAHPTSAVNQQIQIVTVGKVPETEAPAAAAPTAAKKGAKKKK